MRYLFIPPPHPVLIYFINSDHTEGKHPYWQEHLSRIDIFVLANTSFFDLAGHEIHSCKTHAANEGGV